LTIFSLNFPNGKLPKKISNKTHPDFSSENRKENRFGGLRLGLESENKETVPFITIRAEDVEEKVKKKFF